MSTTPATRLERLERLRSERPGGHEQRRVRHQAKDVVALMSFSAGTSIVIAGVLVLAGGVLGSGR